MNRWKNQAKGITLIALVVTIIVLLILAGIVIDLTISNKGLFKRAEDSKNQSEISNVKERAKIDIMSEQTDNEGNLTKDKFIDILSIYFNDVPTEEDLPEDLSTLVLSTKSEFGIHEINISEIYNGEFFETQEKTVEKLKVGEKVYYDTGDESIGEKGIIECKVLYDKAYNQANNKNYGIQIISSDVIYKNGILDTVTLGDEDPTVGNYDSFTKGRVSYNNALKTLYNKVQEYLNDYDKTDSPLIANSVRCVGCLPDNPIWDALEDDIDNYAYPGGALSTYNRQFKENDNNYRYDFEQLKGMNSETSTQTYWMASRSLKVYSYQELHAGIYQCGNSPISYDLAFAGTSWTSAYSETNAIRPVFTLKPKTKIKKGNGDTEPYTLGN